MANFSPETLQQARDAGYNDDQIYDHLSQTDPRFDTARKAGYKLDDVAAHFAPKSSPTPSATPQTGEVAPPVIEPSGYVGRGEFAPSAGAESAPLTSRETPQEQAAQQSPLANAATVATELAQGIPQMAAGVLKSGYEGLKVAAGGSQERTDALKHIIVQGLEQGQQTARDVQSPLGTKESFRGIVGVGMMAIPALQELLFGRPTGIKPPPVQRGETSTTAQPLTETIFGKEPNPLLDGINAGLTEAESLARYGTQPETPNASEITSPTSVTQPEVRTQVGPEASLRQQRTTPEARQGIEAQPETTQGPITLYHGTRNPAGLEGRLQTIGPENPIHLGTEEQATSFHKTGKVFPVQADISNPAVAVRDANWSHNPQDALDALSAPGTPLASTEPLYWEISKKIENAPHDKKMSVLTGELDKLGYDSIKYPNEVEGKGDSYIVWDKSKLRTRGIEEGAQATQNAVAPNLPTGTGEGPISKTVYHGSQSDTPNFEVRGLGNDIGIHFGTAEQADWRVGDNGTVKPYNIEIKNPLRLEDQGGWYGESAVKEINDKLGTKLSPSASVGAIRNAIQKAGYDGVVYKNKFEHDLESPNPPEDSYIVFDKNQIKPASPVSEATVSTTAESVQTVGAASREEYMQRYQALGASKILEGHTELGKFSQEMMKDEPSIPKDDLAEIFNRSKQVVNDLQTAGQSKSQISNFIRKELSKPKPAPFETVRVRPISALKDQYKAAEKAGTAGYKRGLSEARAEGKAAASQIRQELAMSDKWMAGDQEQVRQNMVDYVNSALPPAERGRFIGAITRALRRPALRSGVAQAGPEGMYRHAFNVMKAIENRAAEVYKGNVIQDIKETLSKSLEAPGIDVAYRRQLKSVADSISGTKPSAQTLSRLQGLQDFVNRERAAGREPNIPQEHLDELKNLTRLPLKKMPINALEKLQEQVNSLASLGRLKAKLLERQWENAKANSVAALSKEPSNPIELRPLYKPQPTEKLTVGQKFINAVRKTMNFGQTGEKSIAPMDEIYDHLDGARGTYDGFASQNFKGNLDLAFNEREAELQPIKSKSNEIIKKYGLNKADMETVQTKAIINMVGRERLEAMGVRPDILDKIEKTPLTEGQKAYTDFIRQQYDSIGKRVSDIAHRLYQIDMKPVDNYVPLMRDWAANAEREAPTPLADPISGEVPFNETATMNQIRRDMNPNIVSRTEQGFLKDRIEGAKTAVKLNAEEVFNRHIADALHFIHGQPVLKMLGEIARSPEFASKYGKEGQKIVLDHLDSVANNGFVGHLNRIRVLDWIRNSTSKGAVGFRVASNFVHTSQLPLAAYHAGGPQWWSKGLNLSLTEKGQQFLRRNAAETYVRGGGEPAQAEVEALTGKFGRAGFFVARNIDKLNAQATFMGRYAKEMTERGVPIDQVLDVPVNPEVQSLALRRMHRAVASPQAKDIPQMTSRGKMFGGNVSVARAINQFRNIFLDNWSNIRHDILRAGRKDAEAVIDHLRKGEIAAGAKTVGDAVSHRAAVAAAILSGIAMETGIKLYTKKGIQAGMSTVTGVEPPKVKGQEEKTYLGELQHHMLNRIPFVGQVASAVMYGETGIPTIDAIVSPLKEIGTAAKSRKPETTAKHIVRTTGQVSTLLGIPGSSQAIEAFEPTLSKKLGEHLPDRSKKKETNVSRRGS